MKSGWGLVLKTYDSGMVELKRRKSLFLRGGLLSLFHG